MCLEFGTHTILFSSETNNFDQYCSVPGPPGPPADKPAWIFAICHRGLQGSRGNYSGIHKLQRYGGTNRFNITNQSSHLPALPIFLTKSEKVQKNLALWLLPEGVKANGCLDVWRGLRWRDSLAGAALQHQPYSLARTSSGWPNHQD